MIKWNQNDRNRNIKINNKHLIKTKFFYVLLNFLNK